MSSIHWKLGLIGAGLVAVALAMGLREAAGARTVADPASFEVLTPQSARPLGSAVRTGVADFRVCPPGSGWPFFARRCEPTWLELAGEG